MRRKYAGLAPDYWLAAALAFCLWSICGHHCHAFQSYMHPNRTAVLHQFNHYFDYVLPTYLPSCNVTDYAGDLRTCDHDAHHITCQRRVTSYHAKTCKLWAHEDVPVGLGVRHVKPNCGYRFRFLGAQMEAEDSDDGFKDHLRFLNFRIVVEQQECKVSVKPKGGTTFDLFGYTNSSLASCTNTDHFNDMYMITCRAPVFPRLHNAPSCIYLTVLLEHEHFDAYSLELKAWEGVYANARKVLVDNETFCAASLDVFTPAQLADHASGEPAAETRGRFQQTSSSKFRSGSSLEAGHVTETSHDRHPADSQVSVYSGLWIRQFQELQRHDENSCSSTIFDTLANCSTEGMDCELTSWFQVPRLNASSLGQLLGSLSSSSTEALSLWSNRFGCFAESHDYKIMSESFYPYNDHNLAAPAIAVSDYLPAVHTFRPVLQVFRIKEAEVSSYIPAFEEIRMLRTDESGASKSSSAMRRNCTFMGPSHTRYAFLSTAEIIYGKSRILPVSRKAANITFGKMSYVGVFDVSRMLDLLQWQCQQQQQQQDDMVDVVLEVGDWDLTVGPSVTLRDPYQIPRFITFLSELLSGAIHCPTIHHIVLVTATAYPICYDDSNGCAIDRCFRTNSAVGALNTVLIHELLGIQIQHSKRLSIIDGFTVAMDRILLNENYEIVCKNHFVCAVNGQGSTELVYTPVGMAITQSILHALTSVLPH
jgi:hypothetical protein